MLDDATLTALRAIFGDRLSVSAAVLAEHAQSESLVSAGPPDAVVFPRTTDEVAALGVGRPVGLPLAGESAGLLRPARQWREVELANCRGAALEVLEIANFQRIFTMR